MMKKTVAQREKYSISVDSSSNRIYYTMTGFWRNPQEFSDYLNDWNKAISQVKPGFTILTDVRNFKTPPASFKSMFDNMQKMLNEAGLRKTAELFGKDTVVELSLDSIAKSSGMKKRNFTDQAKAEAWLDE